MNRTEMRNEFVVLYNNVMSNQAPGLNDYEISVFLSKAQDEKLKNYANPKGNNYQEGIDDSLKRQIDFSNLTKTYSTTPISPVGLVKRDPRSQVFAYPTETLSVPNGAIQDNVMFILNEYGIKTGGNSTDMENYISVLPISYQEYQRLMTKPYKWPVFNQGWRLLQRDTANQSTKYIEIVCKDTIATYVMEYIRKPKPIIVSDLDNSVSIDGYRTAQDCELDSILHKEIIQRAVELAKAAYIGDLNATVQMGQRSE